jgi:aquaporin Z
MDRDMSRRIVAEFFGTFWLVLGGCGAAILAAGFPSLGIGFFGVAFAFGLTVLTMAYAVGHISGGHFNPAVTLGLWSAGRCANKHVIPYIVAQVLAAIGQSGAQHRAGIVCRGPLYSSALAVLGGADHRRGRRRPAIAMDL